MIKHFYLNLQMEENDKQHKAVSPIDLLIKQGIFVDSSISSKDIFEIP